jgi:hypothetical protein
MYPQYYLAEYINPSGNIEASGFYRHYLNTKMANMYPSWHHIRENKDSVGQQFMSTFSRSIGILGEDISDCLNEKFISIAPVDEIDVLYRMKVPSTVSFLNNQFIECWTAPSGSTPSGYPFPVPIGANPDTFNSFKIDEKTDLEEFYYHSLPTRTRAYDVEQYSDERALDIGVSFPVKPSGISDGISKHIDFWKKEHNVLWSHPNGNSAVFLKQDSITMETYESYLTGGSGYPRGFCFNNGKMMWIGHVESPSGHFLNVSNPHPAPAGEYLDSLAIYNITELFENSSPPSGIDIDQEGHIWILSEDRRDLYALDFVYDYFLVDKENRFIYFREDYSDPGVFVKPA